MRAALLLMALSLTVLWVWLARYPPLFADATIQAELWMSLKHGGGIGPWLFSIAPMLFPDLGAVALADLCSSNLVELQRWHGFFLASGLGWGGARWLEALWGRPAWQARAFSAAGLMLGFALIPPGGYAAVVAPNHHGWACVIALWAWAWALRQEIEARSAGPQWGLMLFWGLSLSMDRFMMLWTLLPLLLLSLGFSRGARQRVWLTVLGAWPVSWAGKALFNSSGAKAGVFRWSYARQHADEIWVSFKQGLPALFQGHGVALGLALLALLLWLGAAWRAKRPAWALAAWALSLGGSLAVCVLSAPTGRYLLFPFWSLLLAAPALLAMRRPWLGPASLLAPALLGLLFLAAPGPAQAPEELRQAAWMDQMAEQRGLSYGVSDYFHSRPLRLFSQRGLQVLPMISVGPALEPHLWVVDRRLFPDGRLQARPQFAVLNGLDPQSGRAAYGAPKEVLQGEGLELWIFKEHG